MPFLLIVFALNLAVYLLSFLNHTFFISNFALYKGSEFYSFFTYAFLHANFHHLFMNSSMLLIAYAMLKNTKQQHIIILYCGGAIFSAMLYYLLLKNNSILLGASAAISALFGYIAINFRQLFLLVFVLISSVISIIFMPNVAWQAHIFGTIFGVFYALFTRSKISSRLSF